MAYDEEVDQEAGIEDEYYKKSKSHRDFADSHLRVIEDLENQLDYKRRMLEIHQAAADAFQEIGNRAKESMAGYRQYVKRHEPVKAESTNLSPRY